jgi:beta-lactamase regulating signal transducer with metallopeptidase domain
MTGQANFLQSLGWAVLNSLWQLALLWVIYQVITGIFSNAKSSLKSSLASSLLIGGFAWFIYTFLSVYINQTEKTVISSAFVNAESNEQVNIWLQQTLPVASVVYLVLLVLPLLHFIRNYRYVKVVRKYGLTKMHVEWRMFVSKVAAQMNIKKKVQIWVSEFVSSPVTIGFLKPVILVPLAAINHLTPQQLEAVLLHELSHIKRLDYLINLIINFIQTILYFNPFAKAFVKIVEREREKSCDEMVLQFQYDSHEYATALLTLEKANAENKPLAVGAAGNKNDLLNRVELIMGIQRKPVFSFNKLAGLMAGLLCVIALNALLLFSKPGNGNRAVSFTPIASSIHAIQNERPGAKDELVAIEQPAEVINHIKEGKAVAAEDAPSFADYVSTVISPALISASIELANAPELKKYQEEQVERAMEASKKVLESVQWKAVEKSIADVFNQKEKDDLKATYEKEMEKFDWKKWETSLKQAYDKIDWEKINTQLSVAVNMVRLDSIQLVYNKAISKLDGARKELSFNDMKGVPDTDITLKEIERKKADVLRALNELKTVRKKKIVHL